jgi:hypothetical protein
MALQSGPQAIPNHPEALSLCLNLAGHVNTRSNVLYDRCALGARKQAPIESDH